jgi:peptidoglycan/xylan/chitin deacetylase (PgdA/CDA1 family)
MTDDLEHTAPGDLEPFDPRPPRGSRLGQAGLIVGLALVLALAIVAALVLAGVLGVPGNVADASPSASPTLAASPSAAASPTATASATPSFVRPTPTAGPAFVLHTVVPGDTLSSIARQYETTGRSIAYWNRDAYPSLDPESEGYEPDRIEVGWILRLMPGVELEPGSEPTRSPGPASPSPTGAGASSPPSAVPGPPSSSPGVPTGPATVMFNGTRSSKQVALTFDMGGRLDPARDIMGWLVEHEVPATIFPTGKLGSEAAIGRDVVAAVAAHPGLFDLGNHSWDHPDFRNLTAAQMADQITRAEAAIAGPAGQSTRPWFRPPYGGWNEAVRAAVGGAGWRYLALWDVDTIDWRPVAEGGPTAADISAKVVSKAQGGSIVLMHLGGFNTLEALPAIVDGLRSRGFELVTLDDLRR